MDVSDREMRAYYEEEARQQLRQPPQGRRFELRQKYLQLLQDESRRSIIDFGAGPGFDGDGFAAVGISYLGIDFAIGNAFLAQTSGLTVLPASMSTPPVRDATFDAGWCMSALMHVRTDEVPACLQAMAATLRPGAPLCVAQWGGAGDAFVDTAIEGQRRYFSARSFDQNRQLISAIGSIESADVWEMAEASEYHVITVRVR